MSELPDYLVAYFAKRDKQRADAVTSFLSSFTDRERALVQDVAVMGYVQGLMRSREDGVPKDSAIVDLVIDACLASPDKYPAVATIARCPGFPDQCPNLRTVEPDPPKHGGGVRCGCTDDPEDDQ